MITVRELIKRLQQMPQDAIVVRPARDGLEWQNLGNEPFDAPEGEYSFATELFVEPSIYSFADWDECPEPRSVYQAVGLQ